MRDEAGKATGVLGTTGGGAVRELQFEELSIEQKIQRMRGVIESQNTAIEHLTSMVYSLRESHMLHSHRDNGEVVVPVHSINRPSLSGGGIDAPSRRLLR